MTLDDEQLTPREYEDRERERVWRDRQACESVEAMEAYWEGVFRESASHYMTRQVWR